MKRLIFQVAVGQLSNLYDHCVRSARDYSKKIGADYILLKEPILKIKPDEINGNRSRASYEKYGGYLPIYEKENVFRYIKDYDQVAVIDADIYIRPNAKNIFDFVPLDFDLGAVFERELPVNKKYKKSIRDYSFKQLTPLKDFDWDFSHPLGGEFFNSGVIVYNKSISKYLHNQTPEEFMQRKEFKPFIDGIGNWKWQTDQIMLTYWVKKEQMLVKHLPWQFNALYTAIEKDKIYEADFIHFFMKDHLPNKGENISQLMKDITYE